MSGRNQPGKQLLVHWSELKNRQHWNYPSGDTGRKQPANTEGRAWKKPLALGVAITCSNTNQVNSEELMIMKLFRC